jgi:single-stranded DNA-binding protein
MLDPKNMVTLTAGVVADPELINDKIAKFRIALDYAGSEKDADSNVGYFDVTYYLKDKEGYVNKNASFVHSQITGGKIKKGSQISIIGRLLQERWSQDGAKRSKIVVIAEHIAYAPGGAKSSSEGSSSSSSSGSAQKYASVPEEF